MSNIIYGYARVSTLDQKLDLQIEALRAAGCTKIFSEKESGARTARPEFLRLLSVLKEGDTFVVWKLDRASRSLRDLANLLGALKSKKVKFCSVQEAIDTSTPIGNLVFGLTAAFAEFERGVIMERIEAGKTRARAKGVKFGPPVKMTEEKCLKMIQLRESGLDMASIAEVLGVSRGTVFRVMADRKKRDAETIFE